MNQHPIHAGVLVRLNAEERERFNDHRVAEVLGNCNGVGGVELSTDLGGSRAWHRNDLEVIDNVAGTDAQSRAEVDFDKDRPLDLSRSEYDYDYKRVYIYSPAVDGVNKLRVGVVEIANMVGLNNDQIEFLTNKIADAIVEVSA